MRLPSSPRSSIFSQRVIEADIPEVDKRSDHVPAQSDFGRLVVAPDDRHLGDPVAFGLRQIQNLGIEAPAAEPLAGKKLARCVAAKRLEAAGEVLESQAEDQVGQARENFSHQLAMDRL